MIDATAETLPFAQNDESPIVLSSRDELPRWVGLSASTHGLMLLLALTMPENATSLEFDAHTMDNRFVQLGLADMQEPPEPQTAAIEMSAEASSPEGSTHLGDEGKAGDREAPEVIKRLAVQGPADNEDLELARLRDAQIAANAGIASQVTSMFALTDQAVGQDALHALGALDGAEPGDTRGAFGLGIRGDKPGGGGRHEKGIGIGDAFGRMGMGASCRAAYAVAAPKGRAAVKAVTEARPGCGPYQPGIGSGRGGFGLGEKGEHVPDAQVVPREPTLTGSLDREIIKRVVRQHRRELKACYESELQKNKHLGGELLIKFMITPAGAVTTASVEKGSTLQNSAVQNCVTGRIRRWVFPSPDGGGMVSVRYPFRFSAG